MLLAAWPKLPFVLSLALEYVLGFGVSPGCRICRLIFNKKMQVDLMIKHCLTSRVELI